ncbi:MAG: DUF2442 domain-containing protein [Symploca sp. SIO2C1]|nr:DUF2442 domain-containing protein [Symploca sp. SIO2C1]
MDSNPKKSDHFNGLHWVVEDAVYAGEYKVKVWFRDGSVKIVDLKEPVFKERTGDVFVPLQDEQFFSRVRFDEELGTITWSNGADFAPEFLYEAGIDDGEGDAEEKQPRKA